MKITTQTINDLKRNIDLVQAIEYYTGQRAQHSRLICPFHKDKHPSLTVKGKRWTCWACGEHGDIIDFVQKYFFIGFRDAVAKLGADFNISVGVESSGKEDPAQIVEKIQRERERERIKALDEEIDKLTVCRRVLSQYGAPQWQLDKYDAEIDSLILERG